MRVVHGPGPGGGPWTGGQCYVYTPAKPVCRRERVNKKICAVYHCIILHRKYIIGQICVFGGNYILVFSGFSLGHLHMGGICPPPYGGEQVQGDKALMGGLMRGDRDLMGGT